MDAAPRREAPRGAGGGSGEEDIIDTPANVPAAPVPPPATLRILAPAARFPTAPPILEAMKLSRPVSWFLLAFGVWSWFIWITFVKNLWQDGSGLAFNDMGDPTPYFWIHLLLAVASFLLGTAIGVLGFRSVRTLHRERTKGDGSGPTSAE